MTTTLFTFTLSPGLSQLVILGMGLLIIFGTFGWMFGFEKPASSYKPGGDGSTWTGSPFGEFDSPNWWGLPRSHPKNRLRNEKYNPS